MQQCESGHLLSDAPTGDKQKCDAGGLKRIVAEEGVRGLYRGLGPQFIALLPNWAVYFTTYENLKAVMKKREGMPAPLQHMVSAVGAGNPLKIMHCLPYLLIVDKPSFHM